MSASAAGEDELDEEEEDDEEVASGMDGSLRVKGPLLVARGSGT